MRLPFRLLTLLQFTRAALVFTALADTLCALLLQAGSVRNVSLPHALVALTASGCLYAFGMALNDLVDHRRDKLLAASRPIPSGRLGVYTAHLIVSALALSSLVFGSLYAYLTRSPTSFALLLLTMLLISFYNFAGKYLVSAGLLTLGLVRFCHAMIAAPDVPVLWHPLWLFTHIVIVSAVSYVWEEKRPRITPLHAATLYMGVILTNIVAVAVLVSIHEDAARTAHVGAGGVHNMGEHATGDTGIAELAERLSLSPRLLVPIGVTIGFAYLAHRIAAAVGPMVLPGGGSVVRGGGAARGGSDVRSEVRRAGEQRTGAEDGVVGEGLPVELIDPAARALPLRSRRRQAGQQLMLLGLLCLIVYDAAFCLAYVSGWAAAMIVGLLPVAYLSVRLMRSWGRLLGVARAPLFRAADQL